MSSYPSRLAKRRLESIGYSRDWRKPEGRDTFFPYGVLDTAGEPIADTWAQAAVEASKRLRRIEARRA